MRIEIDVDMTEFPETVTTDGQITTKLPKDQQLRFKSLNARYERKLSDHMRKFAIQLMDAIEKQSRAS